MLMTTRKPSHTTTIPKQGRSALTTFAAILCVGYLLTIGTAATLLWTLSDKWWPATVLLFAPRWVLALPLILLVPIASVFHRWSLATLAVSGAVLALPVLGYQFSFGGSTERSESTLRVVSYNIHRQQLDVDAFRNLIESTTPDVVALQDWTSKHDDALFTEPGWYTQRDGELFIASRYPIVRSTQIVSPPTQQPGFTVRYGAAAAYELATPDGPITLVNLHFASPHEAISAMRAGDANFAEQIAFNSQQRDIESAAVADYLDALKTPTIIAGDFNTPRESPVFRKYFGSFVNAFNARGSGFGITHVSAASSVRIDHVLLTSGWTVRECWLAEAAGSPHRPVITDLLPDRTASLQSASSEP